MTHVGWFIWWTYKGDEYRMYEFIHKGVKACLMEENGEWADREYEGEEYPKHRVEVMRKQGTKYGMELDQVGYSKAFME